MRTAKPGKIPGFFASRSRASSMTIAERLIQKGALEVVREIAWRLRDMGWTPERIQEATGLSGEELKKLFPDEQ
ncbi:TPA: hypothetical protein ACGTMM_005075 [Escherichia coli]|uniref:hypothetical protein n=1 Tax=Escherichia coli TaxID=562 RepID=UPI000989969F|nr:hypothetical protein [Escherichia coli]EFW7478216.1 hypothetical protein [Shigella sonnei]EAA4627134.1 hypothetical protein [Escherichia coli]EAA4632559.1 hypothetical protein [Escherichia coli]EEW0004266.1 hypothetical protein [Escherichia coli]EFA5486212.1 hypothetical protein [Escherichia coli]